MRRLFHEFEDDMLMVKNEWIHDDVCVCCGEEWKNAWWWCYWWWLKDDGWSKWWKGKMMFMLEEDETTEVCNSMRLHEMEMIDVKLVDWRWTVQVWDDFS